MPKSRKRPGRKCGHRVMHRATAPMLVQMGMSKAVDVEMYMHLEAFRQGKATTTNFNFLNDMRSCLVMAAAHKEDEQVLAVCDLARIALGNARDTYLETQQMTMSDEEIEAMELFLETYCDFWKRQPYRLYQDAIDAVGRVNYLQATENLVEVQ